jgi:hypothetical protein
MQHHFTAEQLARFLRIDMTRGALTHAWNVRVLKRLRKNSPEKAFTVRLRQHENAKEKVYRGAQLGNMQHDLIAYNSYYQIATHFEMVDFQVGRIGRDRAVNLRTIGTFGKAALDGLCVHEPAVKVKMDFSNRARPGFEIYMGNQFEVGRFDLGLIPPVRPDHQAHVFMILGECVDIVRKGQAINFKKLRESLIKAGAQDFTHITMPRFRVA